MDFALMERLLLIYAICGMAVAVLFLGFLGRRVDPGLVRASWGFRLLVLPACIGLWPVLAFRFLWRGHD